MEPLPTEKKRRISAQEDAESYKKETEYKSHSKSLTRANRIFEKKELENKDNNEENNNNSQYEEGDELESDEEHDTVPEPLTKEESYTLKNILVPKYTIKDLSEQQLNKIMALKALTEEEISKTVKKQKTSNLVKALVSKKKNRFCYDEFDLDLTYITTQIIAMGFPSTSIEGLYRNPMEEVKKFFNTRHPYHYKIYNLCEEKNYDKNTFAKQGYFPFKDHEAPPLNLMKDFCIDAKNFLDEDEKNTIGIHCKAGKGRTGTLISCLLLYMNVFDTADECLQYYGMMRVENGKGVTIPSQIRYVYYFEHMLKNNWPHPVTFSKKVIKKIRMYTLPMFHKIYTPSFIIENNKNIYNSGKKKTISEGEDFNSITEFEINNGFPVEGDVYVAFFRIHVLGKKEKIFKFWFNTNFVPDNGIYEFKKRSLDKACKDKKCKYYRPGFKIEVVF